MYAFRRDHDMLLTKMEAYKLLSEFALFKALVLGLRNCGYIVN